MIVFGIHYFIWHYTYALRDGLRVFKNFFSFEVRFFSIPLLLKTLFAPWQKQNESYASGFHPSQFFEVFVVNTILRLVGFLIRITVILTGIIILSITSLLAGLLLCLWILLPFIIVTLFVSGMRFLF